MEDTMRSTAGRSWTGDPGAWSSPDPGHLPTGRGHLGGLRTLANNPSLPLTQVLRYLILFVTLPFDLTLGQDPGPRYKTTSRPCLLDSQCNTAAGEVCWWYYDGCPRGTCMCDPRWSFQDASDKCRPLKFGNEVCDVRDKCPLGMSCRGGRCRCERGLMTSDRRFCISSRERLLGDMCTPGVDTCYQKLFHGYTSSETFCSYQGLCRCRDGLKEHNGWCQRWNIGDAGCIQDFQCQGGALCIDGTCDCPSGYISVAGNLKCAKIGAKYDLPIGASCDEINENRYCAHDLVCHRCTADRDYTCVKFVPAQPVTGRLNSLSARLTPSHVTCLTTALTTLASILVTRISER